ncbi:MAG TPA: hypothetical protein VHS59_09245 [Bacillota bacterium]|nr:hypothetical protein [Bacillota bacterium]
MKKASPGKRVWQWLTSKKLAVVLIGVMTVVVTAKVLFLARVWTPDPTNMAVLAGKMYSSWWFVMLAGALLVNLSACTVNNFLRRLKSGTKNPALWGSTVFHAGLAVLIIGTLITGQYRIFCSITLIQGEPKSIPYQALLTEATTGFDANDRFLITLLEQKTSGQQPGMEQQTYSDIELKGVSSVRLKTEMTDSQQLSYRDIYLFPAKYGLAAHITVKGPGGRAVVSTSVPLESTE